MKRCTVVVVMCAAVLLAILDGAWAGEKRHLPFSKQTVYSYFRQVEEGRRALPENLAPPVYMERLCRLYASVLERSGYDFDATVQNAAQFADRGHRKLNDPRFLFLAGVFQIHPDRFVALKLISPATRDAVLQYLGR